MRVIRVAGLLLMGVLAACEPPTTTSPVDETEVPSFAMAPSTLVAGSGHIERLGELRSFSLNARVLTTVPRPGASNSLPVGPISKCTDASYARRCLGKRRGLGASSLRVRSKDFEVVWRAADLGSGTKGFPDLISLMTSAANLVSGTRSHTVRRPPAVPFSIARSGRHHRQLAWQYELHGQ